MIEPLFGDPVGTVFRLAVRTDHAHEALCQHRVHRARHQICGNVEIEKAGEGLGASLVCRVESTRWPVSAAWIAICAVSGIADFADENHVGVLAQQRAQCASRRSRRLARSPVPA